MGLRLSDMNIKELSGEIKKGICEHCKKETIVYKQGVITQITKQLAYEEWVCDNCIG